MGDWAYGEFANAKLQDNVDFGWVSHPEARAVFIVCADGFVQANNAPNRRTSKTGCVSWEAGSSGSL
jgi:glucose/mannose transport system substrate-binding protein